MAAVNLETLEPSAKPLDVRTAAREELAPEAQVESSSAEDVSHEGIACNEAAAGQSEREGADVEPVAPAGAPLGKVAFEHCLEPLLAVALDCAALAWERRAAGELSQQPEQRQVRPCSRLELMRLRLRDDDRTARNGCPQGRLEVAKGDLPLHHSAQIVLIEVEEQSPDPTYASSASAALS
jgi:hypothetical protein